jgi:hypothetical protein
VVASGERWTPPWRDSSATASPGAPGCYPSPCAATPAAAPQEPVRGRRGRRRNALRGPAAVEHAPPLRPRPRPPTALDARTTGPGPSPLDPGNGPTGSGRGAGTDPWGTGGVPGGGVRRVPGRGGVGGAGCPTRGWGRAGGRGPSGAGPGERLRPTATAPRRVHSLDRPAPRHRCPIRPGVPVDVHPTKTGAPSTYTRPRTRAPSTYTRQEPRPRRRTAKNNLDRVDVHPDPEPAGGYECPRSSVPPSVSVGTDPSGCGRRGRSSTFIESKACGAGRGVFGMTAASEWPPQP